MDEREYAPRSITLPAKLAEPSHLLSHAWVIRRGEEEAVQQRFGAKALLFETDNLGDGGCVGVGERQHAHGDPPYSTPACTLARPARRWSTAALSLLLVLRSSSALAEFRFDGW